MPTTPSSPAPFLLPLSELERTALHTDDELHAELKETIQRGHKRTKCAAAFRVIAEHHPLESERNLAAFRASVLEGEARLDSSLATHLIEEVPGHLAAFVETRLRAVVAEAKRQDATTPPDHWTRAHAPASVMIALILGPAPERETLVDRIRRREG